MILSMVQNVMLPITFLIVVGVVWQKVHPVPLKPLTHLVLYVMAPALTLASLIRSTVGGDEAFAIVAFVLLSTLGVGAVSYTSGRAMNFDGGSQKALLMATLFRNTGNYGFPVALFAFGESGLDRAVVFNVVEGVLLSTLAVFIAASGAANSRQALMTVVKFPLLHATIVAAAMNAMGLDLPDEVFKPLAMLGDATIPVALVLLGAQLANTSLVADLGRIGLAVFIRLLVAPMAGGLLVMVLGMTSLSGKVSLVMSAMPTAVFASVLATEFDLEPEFVASAVLVSTVLSVFTVGAVLSIVGS